MQHLNIHDLRLDSLKQIIDERGAVYHYLKSDADTFKGFGEAYYSKINQSVIKGWKLHTKISQHFCVPFGSVKLVIYDGRKDSPTNGLLDEVLLNDSEFYNRLAVPPGLWYSFKCMSNEFALLSNIIDIIHSPSESLNLPLVNDKIPYVWE